MIKKHGLKYVINYYKIIPFTVTALLLFLTHNYIVQVICTAMKIRQNSLFYPLYHIIIPLFLAFLWTFSFLMFCRCRRYHYLTRRSFISDTRKYGLTYKDLVEFFKDADPHRFDTSVFPEKSWHETTGIIFGRDGKKLISIPSNSECNCAIFGPPGTGKTSSIAIMSAMQFAGSVVAVDIKGDVYNYVSKHSDRKILRFCPDSPNALQDSCHFDPFANIKTMNATEQRLYIENMAAILIPDSTGTSDGNYFSSRGRKIFIGVTFLLLHENDQHITFPDLVHAILQGNIFDWVKKAIDSDCQTSKEYLASFMGNSEKNVTSAYDALTTALVPFSNPVLDKLLSPKGETLSMEKLESGIDLYLQISQENLQTYAGLFTLIIQTLSTAFTKRPDTSTTSTRANNRPILLLLDEFVQLTFPYQIINSNMSTLRSKSVICMIIMQNLSQLEYKYQPAGARALLGTCNYQIVLGSNDLRTSQEFSDIFGYRKTLKISTSTTTSTMTSTGQSVQESLEKVFPPEYFSDLPADKKMIIYFKGKYIECTKLNCYTDK